MFVRIHLSLLSFFLLKKPHFATFCTIIVLHKQSKIMASTVNFKTARVSATVQSTANHHYSGWGGFVARFKAKRQARKIMRSLDEANQIHSGKRQAKSFDDFLCEL
jgi:hypothetical protein